MGDYITPVEWGTIPFSNKPIEFLGWNPPTQVLLLPTPKKEQHAKTYGGELLEDPHQRDSDPVSLGESINKT